MGLPSIFNIPGSPEQLAHWSFSHAQHHYNILQYIQNTQSVVLTNYILDPFDPRDVERWLWQHQQMHFDMDNALGILGFDLTSVDWSNPEQLAAWIQLNAQEHLDAANITGVAQ
jgi:hypothetical protein